MWYNKIVLDNLITDRLKASALAAWFARKVGHRTVGRKSICKWSRTPRGVLFCFREYRKISTNLIRKCYG